MGHNWNGRSLNTGLPITPEKQRKQHPRNLLWYVVDVRHNGEQKLNMCVCYVNYNLNKLGGMYNDLEI